MGFSFDILRFVSIMKRVNEQPVPSDERHQFEEEQRNWKTSIGGLKPLVRMFLPHWR